MTRYEKMMNSVYEMSQRAFQLMARGKMDMGFMWSRKANELEAIARGLSVEEANRHV